jgi:hypothetical protein
LKAAVLKTVVPKGTVGSNPTSSATLYHQFKLNVSVLFFVELLCFDFPKQELYRNV